LRMKERRTYNGKYRGTETKNAKLTESVIPVIRELNAAGITTRELGKAFGVHHTAIWQAVNYYTWNHVR
jgi:DNA invertase Pin-like site-specific DNA recombinase